MANLIIKSSADNLVLQGSDASPAITVGATGTTTFAENATMSGTLGVTGKTTLTTSESSNPAFGAYATNGGSAGSGADYLLYFQNEEFDIGGCYNNTGSTVTLNGISCGAYGFAPNVAGKYLMGLTAGLQVMADNDAVYLKIVKNGGITNTGSKQVLFRQNTTNNNTWNITVLMDMNGTSDYVQPYVYHNNGTARYPYEGATDSHLNHWFGLKVA